MKSELAVESIRDGIIAVDKRSSGYGAYRENGRFVRSSLQMRGKNGQFAPKVSAYAHVPFINSDVLYFGNVYPEFGHFLLEHMNRAWGLDAANCGRVVLVNNKSVGNVPEYMYELIELAGVKRENVIILNETTRFKSVAVPEQGFNIPVYSSDEFVSVFDKISKNAGAPDKAYDKIYVSRAALKSRKTYGEEKIQRIFEKNGYHVINPELLPLRNQISLMRNCKSLAGCAGTALHLALFMPAGGQVIQIKRNRRNKCNAPIQFLINKSKKIGSVFIAGSIEIAKTDHCSSAPQIIGANEHMRRFFDDFGFEYAKEDLQFDAAAWAEYRDAMKKYKQGGGGVLLNDLKHVAVRLSACLIPGREARGRFRRRMKRLLNARN
jgi:hypothetical protein